MTPSGFEDRMLMPVAEQRAYFRDLASVLWQVCRDESIGEGEQRWRAFARLGQPTDENFAIIAGAVRRIVSQAKQTLGGDAAKLSLVERVRVFGLPTIVMLMRATIAQSVLRLDGLARLLILPEWAEIGYPVVQLGHKLAASLLVTRLPDDVVDATELPWPVFEIELPSGIFSTDVGGEQHEIGCLLAGRVVGPFADDAVAMQEILDSHRVEPMRGYAMIASAAPCTLWTVKRTIRDLGNINLVDLDGGVLHGTGAEDRARAQAMKTDDADVRTVGLLARLFVNVALLLTDSSNVRPIGKSHRSRPRGESGRGSPLPMSRVFQLTTPVRHDFRQIVSEYSRGERSTLSVQGYVVGHWKRQAFGHGRTERKRIFVEPYWRGPEDAPIALRPHKLG